MAGIEDEALVPSCSSIQTRKEFRVYLIGSVSSEIQGRKLPTLKQVMELFFHKHNIGKLTVRESSRYCIGEVFRLWSMARIPTTIERNAIEKLEKVFDRWVKLKKNCSRKTDKQAANEKEFEEDLKKLFDVSHADAMTLINIAEDREFLTDQRGERKGYMSGVDVTLSQKEERSFKRKKRLEERANLEKMEASSTTRLICDRNESDNSDGQSSSEQDDDYDVDMKIPTAAGKRKPKNIVSPQLAAALDRTNVSDRKATFLIAATAECLGHDVSDLAVNRSSIRRSRIQQRTCAAQTLKTLFCEQETEEPVTVHWDSKILPDITGRETVDRLPVLLSGFNTDQLLGVPKLPSATGEAVSNAVVKTLQEWGVQHRTKSMCFDTTASNTGRLSGACALIEAKLGRQLLYLACRHHVHEIVLSDVCKMCLGCSSGP
jgi:hypothetical protein